MTGHYDIWIIFSHLTSHCENISIISDNTSLPHLNYYWHVARHVIATSKLFEKHNTLTSEILFQSVTRHYDIRNISVTQHFITASETVQSRNTSLQHLKQFSHAAHHHSIWHTSVTQHVITTSGTFQPRNTSSKHLKHFSHAARHPSIWNTSVTQHVIMLSETFQLKQHIITVAETFQSFAQF